jgi:hypothetical protein
MRRERCFFSDIGLSLEDDGSPVHVVVPWNLKSSSMIVTSETALP